jgi:branched-chain amino acid transport system permease protein
MTDQPLPLKRSTVPIAILCLLLVCWPWLVADPRLYYQVLAMAFLYGALALAWNIYALTGAISLGHAAFFGLGAYGSALLDHYWHWPVWLAILVGSLAGTLYGALWSIFLRRLRGAYFALATLAAVEVPKVVIDNWDSLTFGSLGMVGITELPSLRLGHWGLVVGRDAGGHYYLLLGFVALLSWIHRKAIQSRWGWAIRAIRENEVAAAAIGIDVFRTRLQAMLVSSSLTAICGALYAHMVGLIEPGLVFGLHLSALPLVLTMFGGRHHSYGPVLGALLLYPLDQLVFHPWLPAGHLALYGLAILLTVFFFPQGVATWVQQRPRPAWN